MHGPSRETTRLRHATFSVGETDPFLHQSMVPKILLAPQASPPSCLLRGSSSIPPAGVPVHHGGPGDSREETDRNDKWALDPSSWEPRGADRCTHSGDPKFYKRQSPPNLALFPILNK